LDAERGQFSTLIDKFLLLFDNNCLSFLQDGTQHKYCFVSLNDEFLTCKKDNDEQFSLSWLRWIRLFSRNLIST